MPTSTAIQTAEERPIHECVSDSSDYHWGNRHRSARATPAISDFSSSGRNVTAFTIAPNYTVPSSHECGGLEPLVPSSPSCKQAKLVDDEIRAGTLGLNSEGDLEIL